ncbi:acetate--CoA ligase family protein [Sphingobium lactosutens]|uniref:ATP-grasp domain-containing protein n=1 Tax=Sphingobium lactosutens DS20 TaxID=1331060 RepID=T0HN63_9SPHN|nr:acetate--CoA ligase family protein [Sphingobium lactosutens]EQB14462.1 hypothetical protein RLDS_13760 [Sphingobium lactosutens DS20]
MIDTLDAAPGSAPSVTRPDLVARLLRPRSIVVIGASAKPGSPSGIVVKMLDQDQFSGDIHLVGRSGGEIAGRPIVPDLAQLPQGIDLAVLTLPAAGVIDAIKACIAAKVANAVIFASGFAETGEDARGAQEMLGQLAREAGIGVVGPNCIGFTNYIDRIGIGFIPVPPIVAPTAAQLPTVAIVAQSGGLMGHVSWALEERGVPVAYRISTGNEAGLGLADYIAYLATDPAVSVISLYAEQIRKPAEFLDAVAQARAAGKPVVMYHTGRSDGAKEAAASHTGALAGDYATMAALASRAGVLMADSIEAWIDCTELLVRKPVPPVQPPAVVTTSGAFCAVAIDYLDELGLELPTLPAATEAALRPRFPEFTPPKNPLDLTTQAAFDIPLTADAIRELVKDDAFGSVALSCPALGSAAAKWLAPLVDVIHASAKPILVTAMGEESAFPQDFVDMARKNGVLLSRSPERALRTVAAVTAYGRSLAAIGEGTTAAPAAIDLPELKPGTQPEWLGKEVLDAIGVARPKSELVQTPDAAALAAEAIGFPVVLKVQAAELAHKTEIGGVLLSLKNADEVRQGFATLTERVQQARPGAVLDGILVEAMAPKGLELVVGAKRDAQWGPVLLVGLGGILVEALKDVRLMSADVTPAEIERELRQLKAAALLSGFRGSPPVDVAAVAKAVAAVGTLMRLRPDITEIDLNPLLALPVGQGVLALDALIVTEKAE